MIIPLQDLTDSRLSDYQNLKDVALRSVTEPSSGLYMAESRTVISRALAAGHKPRSFLMAPRWLETMAPVIASACGNPDGGEVPVFVAEESLLETLTGFHLHRGALAAMQRPELPSLAEILAKSRRIAILEDLVDHTNVGAAFRSAAALGVDAVIVTPRCADPLYRRSIKVSMGTVFQIPWTRFNNWPDINSLHEAGFQVAALALEDDSLSLEDFTQSQVVTAPGSKIALVLGTEGDGLSPRTLAACDYTVRIPMRAGVDSLNVAAAAAVAFWALRLP